MTPLEAGIVALAVVAALIALGALWVLRGIGHVQWFDDEPALRDQLRALTRDARPPAQKFQGHDDELRKASQARRVGTDAERKRLARIDAGGTHESPRLRRVR